MEMLYVAFLPQFEFPRCFRSDCVTKYRDNCVPYTDEVCQTVQVKFNFLDLNFPNRKTPMRGPLQVPKCSTRYKEECRVEKVQKLESYTDNVCKLVL